MEQNNQNKWQVVAFDWNHEVIAEFFGEDAEEQAKAHAEALDRMSLRCYARWSKE